MSTAFDQRYALATLGHEGVLVDLQRGLVLLLNASALAIWEMARDGLDTEAAATKLVAAYGLPIEQARRDIAAALDVARVPISAPRPEPFHYQRAGDRYLVTYAGHPVFENTPDGEGLRLVAAVPLSEAELRSLLIPLAAKLLALQGARVLHASAVAVGGGILAFSGQSGAGKTTTARAFADAGAAAITEDKLVLAADGTNAVVEGERRIHAWATAAAQALATGARECDARPLQEARRGPTLPLSRVAMLDVSQRRPGARRFELSGMTEGQAAAALLLQTFVGTTAPEVWRRNLESACALAAAVPTVRLTTPDGLEALAEAVRAYASNSTS